MKIYFIARGWPSKREPQWGCFERDQALALKALGHEIVVLSVDSRFRTYYRKYGITKIEENGILIFNLYLGFIWGRPLTTISMKAYSYARNKFGLFLFKYVVRRLGMPDILYGHYLGGCSMALFLKKKYGIPAVGIEHWSKMGFDSIEHEYRSLAESTYPYLDKQIVVSSALKRNILKNVGVETMVVNNMIGDEFCYKPHINSDGIVRFISVGSLLPVKGFDNLINAFSKLNMSPGTWMLNIIGGGKEHDNLQDLIDRMGLSNNIHLLGRKSREGVIDMLHQSDVYVMSSRSETFGVAAIEALACGLPVIATECGGAADFMNKDNGVTCPVNNVEELSGCISHMISRYQEYDRAKIAADCQKRFSSKTIGKQLEGIFDEILRKSKKQ